MREFFVRLAKTTGQAVGQDFLRRLEQGQGDLRMFSPDMAVPLAALKKLAPGHELEQMGGLSIGLLRRRPRRARPEVQMRIANVDGDVFMRALEDPGVQAAAEAGREEALDILGDFVVYPTLFLETDDGERHVLARGYADYRCGRQACLRARRRSRRLGDTPRQRVRPRRALRYFSMKGKDRRGAFQKSSLPNPSRKNFDSWGGRATGVRSGQGKTSYPMCKPFPAVPPNQKPAQHVRAGFILSTRKSDKEDSITSKALGGRIPGGTLLSMPVKPEDAPNDHSSWGRHPLPGQ